MTNSKDLEIDPAEIINVDFDRDLGPMHRKLIHSSSSNSNKRVLNREQRKISDKMTNFETLDEIYLMVISGMAPIGRIPYLETLAPKLAKYPKPQVTSANGIGANGSGANQDQDDHDSNSTVSYPGLHRGDTNMGMTDISGEFNSEFITESKNSSFTLDDDESRTNMSSV